MEGKSKFDIGDKVFILDNQLLRAKAQEFASATLS